MKWFEKFILAFHPPIQIPSKWNDLWQDEIKKGFKVTATIFCIFWAITYLLHYFYVDIPLKKEPLSDWAFYRFSCAAVSIIALILTFMPKVFSSKYRKYPIAIAGIYFTFMQAESMVWREQIPYLYITIIPALTALTISTSVLNSMVFMTLGYTASIPGILARPEETAYIFSSHVVGLLFVCTVRSTYAHKVKAFISSQESLESKKKIIELQTEIQDQIKSFLPKIIYNDFKEKVDSKRMSVHEAFNEVTEIRERTAAILYSDIRGFTKSSRISRSYLKEQVVPNLQDSASIVEKHFGVPRQIGDLMFAYYNNENDIESIKNALQSAFELIHTTEMKNADKELTIKRHAIISFGDVIIGNMGGDEFSKEITVHGDPANIGSRIDPLTKENSFLNEFKQNTVILTPELGKQVKEIFPAIELSIFELKSSNLALRDFEDIHSLIVLPVNQHNIKTVLKDEERSENKPNINLKLVA